jgi:hypothetical protein
LTDEEIAEPQAWFDIRGKFPAMHVVAGKTGQ